VPIWTDLELSRRAANEAIMRARLLREQVLAEHPPSVAEDEYTILEAVFSLTVGLEGLDLLYKNLSARAGAAASVGDQP
jgi:hypothetical protein